MKILQVCPVFYPMYPASGSAKVAYDISRMLSSRGKKVVLFTTDRAICESCLSREIKNYDGIDVFLAHRILPSIFDKQRIYITSCNFVSIIKQHIETSDVIHIHEYRTLQNIIIHHFAIKYGVPYILQAHGSLSLSMAKKKLKRIYDVLFGYRLVRDASKVIALNRMEAYQYRRMGVPEENIAIIPNGIDLSEYAELPLKGSFKKMFDIPKNRKIILYLGRIHRTKGINLLVKSYAHLINEMNFNNTVLGIAGPDGGYLNEAKALANSLGVYNSIIFTGLVSSKDKIEALVDADVFVTPSFYGFPITFLEACAVGTPIVTTNLEDTLEWIDNKVGFVTQPTPYDLAKAIYRIISDDELHRKFSKNCIKIVRSNFSLEKVVERLEKIYEEVVKR